MGKISVNGILFDFIGVKPYTRLDGTSTTLRCWRKQCEHLGCTEQWEFATPGGKYASPAEGVSVDYKGRIFTKRECSTHFKRKTQDHSAGGRASARISDAEVAELRSLAANGVSPVALSFWFPLTPATIREIIAGRRRQPT